MNLFFELLQVALGTRESLSHVPSAMEWEEVKELCMKHAVPGVGFYAIRKLSERSAGSVPPRELVMELYALERRMSETNAGQMADASKLTWLFEYEGFASCVLKGCGLAGLYPHGMARVSGDIDIWVMPKGKEGESLNVRRREVLALCRKVVGYRDVFYHHTDLPLKGKEIEVHFTPSWMFAPWHNARLQRFFQEEWHNRCFVRVQETGLDDKAMGEGFYVPSLEMNAVYVLLHIYRHVFAEGVGLRQVVDYFYVLHQDGLDKERVKDVLKSLGMIRFAGAVMWVMQEAMGLEKGFMLCAPNERRGRLLLAEIMQAGNFGKWDERLSGMNRHSLLSRMNENMHRNMRLVRHYPSEALCAPIWKAWQKLWRLTIER